MNASHVGASSELLVAVNLMEQGWEVFRALSPSATCDLVAMQDGVTIRVEVKTAHSVNGKIYCSPCRPDRFDLLAVVLGKRIFYPGEDGSYLQGSRLLGVE